MSTLPQHATYTQPAETCATCHAFFTKLSDGVVVYLDGAGIGVIHKGYVAPCHADWRLRDEAGFQHPGLDLELLHRQYGPGWRTQATTELTGLVELTYFKRDVVNQVRPPRRRPQHPKSDGQTMTAGELIAKYATSSTSTSSAAPVTLSSSSTGSMMALATGASLQQPSPVIFPATGYVGVAADFADLYAQCFESPKEFLYADQLTIIGAHLSGRVRADFGVPCQPRLYSVKVAPSAWWRKSTSTKLSERFFYSSLSGANNGGIICGVPQICYGVGSAEGLARMLQHNAHTVLYLDEFRQFEAKAGITNSALLPMVNILYEANEYENAVKNFEDSFTLADAHLALLANTTTENYANLVKAAELRDIGFLNRLFLVAGQKTKKHARPKDPPAALVQPIQRQLAQYLTALPSSGELVLPLTAEADRLWTEWYDSLPELDETARLDNLGMRLLSLLAFTSGRTAIDKDIVLATLDILAYQRQVRSTVAPVIAASPAARMEQRIIRAIGELVAAGKPTTKRDIQRRVHPEDNEGSKVFTDVWNALLNSDRLMVRADGKSFDLVG